MPFTEARGLWFSDAKLLRALRHDLLHHFEDRAAARYAITPHSVEIGDQRLDLVGGGSGLRRFHRVISRDRDMDSWIAAAPTAPGAARLEGAQCPGQVIGLVPMIEARPLGFGHLCAHRKKRFCHGYSPRDQTPALESSIVKPI